MAAIARLSPIERTRALVQINDRLIKNKEKRLAVEKGTTRRLIKLREAMNNSFRVDEPYENHLFLECMADSRVAELIVSYNGGAPRQPRTIEASFTHPLPSTPHSVHHRRPDSRPGQDGARLVQRRRL